MFSPFFLPDRLDIGVSMPCNSIQSRDKGCSSTVVIITVS